MGLFAFMPGVQFRFQIYVESEIELIIQKVCGKRKDVQKKKSIDKSCKCNKRNAAEKHISSENIHFDIAGRTFSQQTVASNKMKLLNLS